MYAKVFAQIFDSSLREKWQAWVTFVALLALADKNDEVDMTPQALAGRTGLPGSIILEGIEFLERPDENSRTPDEEGRRIVRLDDHRPWGWRIVNRKKYKDIRDQSDRTEYHRRYSATHRNTLQPASNNEKPYTDTDTDTKKKNNPVVLPDWVDPDLWKKFVEFRKSASRGRFTDHAQKLNLAKLTKLREDGNDPVAVIEQTIERGWTGFFPVKPEPQRQVNGSDGWEVTP